MHGRRFHPHLVIVEARGLRIIELSTTNGLEYESIAVDDDVYTYIEDKVDPFASESLEKWLPLCSDNHVIYPRPPKATEMGIRHIEEEDRDYIENDPANPWLIFCLVLIVGKTSLRRIIVSLEPHMFYASN